MTEARDGRERLLREARTLFVARGYADVSMQEIADAAGLRKATLYHHFADKQDLFTQVAILELRTLREDVEALATDAGSFHERLERLALINFEGTSRPDWVRLSRDFRQHVPEGAHAEMHRELEALLSAFGAVFQQQGTALTVPPRVAALLFFHMVMGWAMHAIDDPTLLPESPRQAARTVVDVLLYGVAGEGASGTDRAKPVQPQAPPPVSQSL